jgi:hypothetical protein
MPSSVVERVVILAVPDDGGGVEDPGDGGETGGGTGDGDAGPNNNEVEQSNTQDIEDVDDDSEASNTGVNNAEF